jgi:hypothetical protein
MKPFKVLDFLIYTAIAIGIVFGLWWYVGKARAQSHHTVRVCAWLNWDGSCHYTYHRRRTHTQHYRREVYREPSRVYSYERRERREERDYTPICRTMVTAVGEEKYGADRAKEAAAATWMEAVRHNHGTKYMDPKNARHLSYECGRSSTGNRASEKAADTAGRFLEQCELRATPCRSEKETGN